MSLAGAIGRKLRDDTVHALSAPYRTYDRVRTAIWQIRTGRRSVGDLAKTVFATAGATALVVVLMFPIYWIFTASLSQGASLIQSDGVFADPSTYNLDAYRWLLFESNFFFENGEWGYPAIAYGTDGLLPVGIQFVGGEPGALFNSLTVVIVTIITAMAMIIPGAYALSRRAFTGRTKLLYFYILFTQVGSGLSIATLIALLALFTNFGLTNNLIVLGIFYGAGAIPFNTWLLKTYMDNIPVSYEEAAVVDGAGRLDVMREVILPLSKPGLAAITIFVWLAGWNEFIIAQTLLRPENYTLSVEVYSLATSGRFETPWTEFAAFAILFALPVALIYFFAQRYVESGLSFGGMEG